MKTKIISIKICVHFCKLKGFCTADKAQKRLTDTVYSQSGWNVLYKSTQNCTKRKISYTIIKDYCKRLQHFPIKFQRNV